MTSDRIEILLDRALKEHGASAFWNTPLDLPTPDMARIAVAQLRKHGGREGWLLAAEISRELAARDADTAGC